MFAFPNRPGFPAPKKHIRPHSGPCTNALECHTLLDETDFLLRVVTGSVEAYERFFRDHLSQLPAARGTVSSIALSEIKNTSGLPLSLV